MSTEYLNEFNPDYLHDFMHSKNSRLLLIWINKYYTKYNKAPKQHIQSIFDSKVRNEELEKDQEEWISDILESLSDEYENSNINIPYLLDETEKYLQLRSLKQLNEDLENILLEGDTKEAEALILKHKIPERKKSNGIEIFKDFEPVRKAFEEQAKPLIKIHGALGQMMNSQLTRDSFIGIMGPEKRGKTFTLMELAFQGVKSRNNVAFFQAGDMTEPQQIIRMGVYLAKKSNKSRYCKKLYLPVLDCIYNQIDSCENKNRNCDFGIFDDFDSSRLVDNEFEKYTKNISFDEYKKIYERDTDYKACTYCRKNKPQKFKGAVWYSVREKVKPLTAKEAYKIGKKFFNIYKKKLMLETYPNDSLSIKMIENQLDIWEKKINFIADVIIIDYADLLVPSKSTEFRHQQNQIWKDLRSLSQKRHICLITATQADAKSYDQETVQLKNFSEDKRKYAHVTAMYGLNQTADEKLKGIMRVNELLVRDDDFSIDKQVKVLQSLQRGRPHIGSYF